MKTQCSQTLKKKKKIEENNNNKKQSCSWQGARVTTKAHGKKWRHKLSSSLGGRNSTEKSEAGRGVGVWGAHGSQGGLTE